MYNRIYRFFSDNNIIYSLQFGFRQKHSMAHALISLTESIRKNLDEGNLACGIFVVLQKVFDTVEHDILLSKLEHYGVCGLDNEWLKSSLSNRKQYISINGYDLNLADVKFGVPQGSVLGPLVFLIYINDLNHALKFRKVHHFADNTNLLHFSKSVNTLYLLVKCQQNLTECEKIELVILKPQRKKIDSPLKIKVSCKGSTLLNCLNILASKLMKT